MREMRRRRREREEEREHQGISREHCKVELALFVQRGNQPCAFKEVALSKGKL
jgi:hypothetical protein